MADEKKAEVTERLARAAAETRGETPVKTETPAEAKPATPAAGTPATPAVAETKEFSQEDPTFPNPKSTEVVSRAKKPISTRVVKNKDGVDETIGTFRLHEKGTPVDAFVLQDYKVGTGNVLTDEGKATVKAENERLAKLRVETMAKLHENKGGTLELQAFIRKNSTYMLPIVRNDVGITLSTITKAINKDAAIAQKGQAIKISEKGTGPVLSHILIVPTRAYEVLSGGQTVTDEQITDIITEAAPELKVVYIPKAEFATAQIAIFGGYIKVAPEMFDSNASKVANLADIPSINGLPAGQEFVTYELDNSKCFITTQASPVVRKAGESDDAFKARQERHEKKLQITRDYQSGHSTLEQKAAIIRTKNTMHNGLATEKNFLPVNTFDTISIGKVIDPKEAAELNSVYLGNLVDPSKVTNAQPTTEAMSMVDIQGGSIQSSIFFPANAAFANKVPQITRLYRTRKADGTTEKPQLKPTHVVKKMRTKTAEGTDTIVVCKNEIGSPSYKAAKYNSLKGLFEEHLRSIPEAQRANISFPTYEEVKLAVSKQRATATKSRTLSSTGYDRNAVDIQAMMADLSLGDGTLTLAANAAQEAIKAAKESKVKSIDTFTRFTPENLRAQINK